MINTKVVINKCFGGFKIRQDVADEIGWTNCYSNGDLYKDRTDPKLISALERRLSNGISIKPDGEGTRLKIVEIPDDVNWYIENYDGLETIHEEHRSWS